MKIVLLLVLLSVSKCSSTSVVGRVGENVTLSCRYDRKYHGALSVCWGRGNIPTAGCNKTLIYTDGQTMSPKVSRFQLLGRLDEGDVSLTILNLTESDSGRYGCRVEINGWFNDEKHHFDLIVQKVSERSSTSVVGRVGENVTLSCRYDAKANGVRPACWGRGDIPSAGCNNQLIYTDGQTVSPKVSRFQLLGRLDKGDVSLTILNLTESDSGRYGCRVEIYGWFNDIKHHFDLIVQTALVSAAQTTTEPTRRMTTEPTLISATGMEARDRESMKAEQVGHRTTFPVFALLGLEVLLASALILINIQQWELLNKMPQQVSRTVCFSLTLPTLREPAVKNIDQIDGGEYTIVEYKLNLQPQDSNKWLLETLSAPAVPPLTTRCAV